VLQFGADPADGMGTVNTPRNVPALVAMTWLGLFAGACATSSQSVDLANNDQLYKDVPFATKAPGDRAVFVAPLVDGRVGKDLPTQERGFPITYGDDQVWERPVPVMVGEVLQRQLQSSGLFTEVAATASPQALVLKPTLVSFLTGAAESMAGSSSFAEVGLRLQVFGPADATGKRAVLFEDLYANRQMTEVALNPVSPYRLIGRALHISVGKALAGLDGSNVSRSNVPIEVVEPVAVPAGPPDGK